MSGEINSLSVGMDTQFLGGGGGGGGGGRRWQIANGKFRGSMLL